MATTFTSCTKTPFALSHLEKRELKNWEMGQASVTMREHEMAFSNIPVLFLRPPMEF
jgi:hypothetical protein